MKAFFSKLKQKIKNIFKTVVTFLKKVFDKVSKWISTALVFIGKHTGITWLYNKYRVKFSNKTKKAVSGYLFILPWLIGLTIFAIQPILNSLRMAFSDSADYAPEFRIVGWSFAQFTQIFKDNPLHVEAIINTFTDVLIVVPLVLIFSLLLSLLLNNKIKGIKVFRMIFFVPVILLSGNLLGYFNNYNLLTVPALQSGELRNLFEFYFPVAVVDIIIAAFSKIILILWLSGVQTLIFLAGLQKTNKSVYEAAAIDGANKWETFWKITFPSLMPLININIIYTTVIYSNLGNELTKIISTSSSTIEYGRDYTSALSWILFIIELVIIAIYFVAFKLANKKYQ